MEQAEFFVIQKLTENGWKLKDTLSTSNGLIPFEKNGRTINIQVKRLSNAGRFCKNYIKGNDYQIYTDLVDLWIIPIDLQEVIAKRHKTVPKLKNRLILLEKTKLSLLNEINDFGVRFGELDNENAFFHP